MLDELRQDSQDPFVMNKHLTRLETPTGPITIRRSPSGAPEIDAADLPGAIEGLGFCHARDRGMQMLVVRTLAQGQASKLLKPSQELFELDRFFRKLDFQKDLAQDEQTLDPHLKSLIDAYCRGVNRYFSQNKVPWELRLAGFPKHAHIWTFADIYLTGKIIGYVGLAQTQADLERFIVECVQHGISREQLAEMFPGELEDLDEELVRKVRVVDPILPPSVRWMSAVPTATASNNWAVAGTKTASGKPFLANDPHLEINRLPCVWYEVALYWRKNGLPWYAMGATMPGTTALVVGRNPELAWGVTYAYMDCIDSWIEECRDGRYRRGDDWLPFRERKEVIERRGMPATEVVFYDNGHGTLSGNPYEHGYYLATRWSNADGTGVSSLAGFAGLLEATNADDARSTVAQINNSAWSWLLADRSGNIAYQMSGNLPIRAESAQGLAPKAGWDPANDWQGFADPLELPRDLNPPRGFLATANQNLNHLGQRKPINACVPPYRSGRIDSVLESNEPITIDICKDLQLDLYSLQADRFLEILRPLLETLHTSEHAQILLSWDRRYDADSHGAYVFERFYRLLIDEVFDGSIGSRLGSEVLVYLYERTICFTEFYGAFDNVMLAERSTWFGQRTREAIYKTVLERLQSEPIETYCRHRKLRMKHMILGGKLPLILGFDRGWFPLPGCRATVCQFQRYKPGGRDVAFGPSYRLIADLATDEAHSALPGGPSDRRFSPWYASGIADWIGGKYAKLVGRTPQASQ